MHKYITKFKSNTKYNYSVIYVKQIIVYSSVYICRRKNTSTLGDIYVTAIFKGKLPLNNEVALKRFLGNGNIEIDNNAAERALRSVAVGRKNWLFAGSDKGGKTAAIIYTILETAKLNNVNPVKYLHKVFDIIQDYKANKLQDLLPWNIKLE